MPPTVALERMSLISNALLQVEWPLADIPSIITTTGAQFLAWLVQTFRNQQPNFFAICPQGSRQSTIAFE